MTDHAKHIAGVILVTVPSIQYGGYFLLKLISGQTKLSLTEFQKSMFRAGHAHAGVLVMFAILAQLLIDNIQVSQAYEYFLRLGFPLAAILVSGGFFASASGRGLVKPNKAVVILYLGILLLAAVVVGLGIALI